MPKARYLAPWHRADVVEAWEALAAEAGVVDSGGRELDAAALAGLRGKPAIYHCLSRVVDRRFVLETREKEKFVALMRLYERFCQARVLAFCVMSNHFHILLEVPAAPAERGRDWSDEKFLKHLSGLYSEGQMAEVRWQLELFREQKADAAAEEFRDGFFARMWDLSQFMRLLKQVFSRWFNKVHERCGTLWEERFKSVLVEGGHAARIVAAYIDLNPVRAKMVADPKDYRWCSYGEAVGGKQRAREGIQQVMLESEGAWNKKRQAAEVLSSWRVAVGRYREVLFAYLRKGTAREGEEIGPLTIMEVLDQQVRQFKDGLVVGLGPFVDQVFRWTRNWFGPNRKDGARPFRGVSTELRAMRDVSG